MQSVMMMKIFMTVKSWMKVSEAVKEAIVGTGQGCP